MNRISKKITEFALIAVIFGAAFLCLQATHTDAAIQNAAVEIDDALLDPNINISIDGKVQQPVNQNGQPVYPILYNGSTYVPVRGIAYLLGKNVSWDSSTRSVLLTDDPITAPTLKAAEKPASTTLAGLLPDKSVVIKYNGLVKQLTDANGNPIYPILYNGITYIPLRGVSTLYGKNVYWDATTRTAIITNDYLVTTYEDLLKAITIPDNDTSLRNIVIRGNIKIPAYSIRFIVFKQCTVTIDEGYTFTSTAGTEIDLCFTVVMNVKGTLALPEGASLRIGDSGTLNVTDGKVTFEKGANLFYLDNAQINGMPNVPEKGEYTWDGLKFGSKQDWRSAPNLKSTVKPSFEVKAEIDYTIDGSILLFSKEPMQVIDDKTWIHTYIFPVGTKIAQDFKGQLVKICAQGESFFKQGSTDVEYTDYTNELTLTEGMCDDPNGIRISSSNMGRGLIIIKVCYSK